MRRIIQLFLNGILYTVPISITIYIIWELFVFFDDLLDAVWPFEKRLPGLGVLTLLILITTIGFLGSTLVANPIRSWFDRMLIRAPLVKTIYRAINDLVSAFVGQKKRFNQPVLVKVNPDSNLEKLGFITDEDLSKFNIDGSKVAVYLPHSYAFSGNLFIVPASSITLIDANASDVMKYIVSGGVSDLDRMKNEQ